MDSLLVAPGLLALLAALLLRSQFFVPALLVMLGVPLTFFGALGTAGGDPSLMIALLSGLTMLGSVRIMAQQARETIPDRRPAGGSGSVRPSGR